MSLFIILTLDIDSTVDAEINIMLPLDVKFNGLHGGVSENTLKLIAMEIFEKN